jgi:hypothetical protein
VSSGEKALGFLKTVFTLQEQVDRLNREVVGLSDRLSRLSDSHVALRERVVVIETFLRTTSGQPFSGPPSPRIENK